MRKTVDVTYARGHLPDIMNQVAYVNKRIVLKRRGKPVVAIISLEDLEKLERIEDERDAELLTEAMATAKEFVTMEDMVNHYERETGRQVTQEPETE